MRHSKALHELNHELILAHIKNPEQSPLPMEQQEVLQRVISVSKLLDRYPTLRMAVKLHKVKFPEISDVTAYADVRLARKVYNSMHTFDFDFWKSWLINDIVKNIEDCRSRTNQDVAHKRVIAMEHANLLKAVGEKPEEMDDPHRNEKHNFFLMVNINNKNIKIDVNNLHKLPENTLREINTILNDNREIDEQGAAEIIAG